MGENFTSWGWGTQNLCAKTGTDSGAGSCVNFRKSLIFAKVVKPKNKGERGFALPCFDFILTMVLYFQQQFYMRLHSDEVRHKCILFLSFQFHLSTYQ